MGKRRKSRRRNFERRKYDIRNARNLKAAQHVRRTTKPDLLVETPQTRAVPEQPDDSLLDRHHPNASFTVICEQAAELCDASWRIVRSERNIQFFIVDGTAQPVITRSVTVDTDLSYSVFVHGKQLAVDESSVLSDLPRRVSSMDVLIALLDRVKSSNTCPGNPDSDFVDMIVKEGGQFLGTHREVVATLDASTVVQTVRVSDCEILCEQRCVKCRNYRTSLRVKRSRSDHCDDSVRVAHDSHATYANLPRESLVERLKNTYY